MPSAALRTVVVASGRPFVLPLVATPIASVVIAEYLHRSDLNAAELVGFSSVSGERFVSD